ncbi:MAG: histidinol-phosphate transaminase [Candidatus Brocadiales bacterium]|nr:histidinol-phosphate transaminase [Candidatus Brocadiales bacterium]
MNFFRKNIKKMTAYVPGEQPQEPGYIKLNTNENPYTPSPRVLAALKEAASSSLRLYPDPMATQVRKKVAEVLGTRPERVLVGNGSDELLGIIARSFAGPGDKIVFPYPTYLLYKTLAEIQDAIPVEVDFPEDFSLPRGIVVKGAKITFLCNPNSPSGTMVWPEEVSQLARQIEGVLVIDEAYVDFADTNCLSLVEEHPNVLMLRTVSKSYSLAGLRLGFCIAQEPLIEGMLKVKDSYNVDRLSMAAGLAALDDQEHLRTNLAKVRETRAYLTESLREMGFFVYPSQANFVFLRCQDSRTAREIYEQLKSQRILIRHLNYRKLEDCLRISVGTPEEIERLLECLSEITCEARKGK